MSALRRQGARWKRAAMAVPILVGGAWATVSADVAQEGDRRPPPEPIPEENFHPEPAPADDPGSEDYVVQPGDTLSGIARRELGAAGRWPEIARDNELSRPDRLRVGQRLLLPRSQ